MSEWISIKEKLPPEKTRVLCWIECSRCRNGTDHSHSCVSLGAPYHGIYIDWLMVGGTWFACSLSNITHWHHLPEEPGDEKENGESNG